MCIRDRDERGAVEVGPRAVERVAEVAAVEHPAVNAVAGRLEDEEVTVNLTVTSPRGVDETLTDVHRRVREALTRHDLGDRTVNVTVTGFDRQPVSYTHLRAHETKANLVCRLLL